jgi:hypothetical protein
MTRKDIYDDKQNPQFAPEEKLKPYQHPELTEYGTIEQLTHGSFGDYTDAGGTTPYQPL